MTTVPRPGTRRRSGLALRICLLTTSVALLTALVAGALAVGLIRRAEPVGVQNQLGRLADAVAQEIDAGTPARSRPTLRALRVGSAVIGGDGTVSGAPLARSAVSAGQARAVLEGRRISTRTSVGGQTVFVQARPTDRGGVVLVQRQVDAESPADAALRRLLIALAVGAAVAVGLGLVFAWRLARPLRRTAAAAHALAAGARDVSVRPDGPSEIAAVAEALNGLSDGLTHSEARQREFLLSVSHDLRTPLTALRGYAEALADGVSRGADARHAGTVMLGEAQRLERMVADLLDLARLDAADLRIDPADIELTDLLRGAATVWADRCAAAGVEFRRDIADGPVPVRTDPVRLRQVLDGLFDNALRVTPAGRPIVLAGGYGGPIAVAEVRDGGPGLSDDDLAVAFERGALYERYRGVRRVGTGLGLAIVHRLVTRLDGTIEAGHATEGGARFTVRLPVNGAAPEHFSDTASIGR